jgi:hypothetical protein
MDSMQTYPETGETLASYDIGCTPCQVGISLLKDVVFMAYYWAEAKAGISFSERCRQLVEAYEQE